MMIKQSMAILRKRVESHPRLKVKLLWILNRLPIIKRILASRRGYDSFNGIKNYNELSKSGREIYFNLKSNMKANK